MGLPTRSAVRSIDTTVAGIDLRLTAFLGDSLVYLSRSGSEIPRAAEVDRICNGTAQQPRIALYDSGLIPGLLDVADAITSAAADFYRHPDNYEPAAGQTPAAVTTGSAP